MTARERLSALLADDTEPGRWLNDAPAAKHYKRITIDEAERLRLAKLGGTELTTAFGVIPFYTQAIIAGAALSGDFDKITVCTPWQYGKTWLCGRLALLLARRGDPVYIAANTGALTTMMMTATLEAVKEANPAITAELIRDDLKKTDKIGASLSREKVAFARAGFVQALSLGGTYDDTKKFGAMGKGGVFIKDEAADIPDRVNQETLRGQIARKDGRKYLELSISNPHSRGWFYSDLTKDNPDPRHLIVWMDALTVVQEGNVTRDRVIEQSEDMSAANITKYWLCELPDESGGMFTTPKIDDTEKDHKLHFVGIDSAYKGRDDIAICHITMGETLHANRITRIDKRTWTSGEDIILQIVRECKDAAAVFVDNGQGLWIVEGLLRYRIPVQGVYFGAGATKSRVARNEYAATNAANLRAEMHLDVQELFEKDILTVTSDVYDQIRDTLPVTTMERQANTKIKIRDKEEIKAILGHSPDAFDSLLLAVHGAIMYARERLAYIT